jgi:RecB family exonuclease
MPAFTLNSAVDALLKNEFDAHRVSGKAHPIMINYGIDAIPLAHADMDNWRHNFHGVQYLHQPTNLLIYGAVDDVWVDPKGRLVVVDYKSTSKDGEVTLDDQYKEAYKRQLEIYQWLLRKNGYEVAKTGYFVYANGVADKPAFNARLEFKLTLLPYEGDDEWVEPKIVEAYKCLNQDVLPASSEGCEFCLYRQQAKSVE